MEEVGRGQWVVVSGSGQCGLQSRQHKGKLGAMLPLTPYNCPLRTDH